VKQIAVYKTKTCGFRSNGLISLYCEEYEECKGSIGKRMLKLVEELRFLNREGKKIEYEDIVEGIKYYRFTWWS
jgi:hypothetical protein